MRHLIETDEDGEVLSSTEVGDDALVNVMEQDPWGTYNTGGGGFLLMNVKEITQRMREKPEAWATLIVLLGKTQRWTNAVSTRGGVDGERVNIDWVIKATGCSRNTVWAHLRYLKKKGIIKRGALGKSGGKYLFVNPGLFLRTKKTCVAVYDMFKEENESGAGREE